VWVFVGLVPCGFESRPPPCLHFRKLGSFFSNSKDTVMTHNTLLSSHSYLHLNAHMGFMDSFHRLTLMNDIEVGIFLEACTMADATLKGDVRTTRVCMNGIGYRRSALIEQVIETMHELYDGCRYRHQQAYAAARTCTECGDTMHPDRDHDTCDTCDHGGLGSDAYSMEDSEPSCTDCGDVHSLCMCS
jgi:DnaJ-class molecular chaperone